MMSTMNAGGRMIFGEKSGVGDISGGTDASHGSATIVCSTGVSDGSMVALGAVSQSVIQGSGQHNGNRQQSSRDLFAPAVGINPVASSCLDTQFNDIGKFLGFQSLDQNVPSNVGATDGQGKVANGGRNRMRKRQRWTEKEKGNGVASAGDRVHNVGSGDQLTMATGVSTGISVPMKSFAQAAGRLPEISLLPDPIVSGGITRVVLPQAAVDRQMANEVCPASRRTEVDKNLNNMAEKVVQPNGDNVKEPAVPVVERDLSRWADVVEEEEMINKDAGVFNMEEGEIHPPNDMVTSPLQAGLGDVTISVQENVRTSPSGMVAQEAQVTIANVNVKENIAKSPVRTITSSPGGTTVVGTNGRIEVVFPDVQAVDEAMKDGGDGFSNVGKKPPGRPTRRGNKKADVTSMSDTRQIRQDTLRKKGTQ
ncbi:hypothetical protein NE237_016321 [Protea cynaroides]|uniref:Uncharacterized protein n=1 Tax=Protea cynaroides TaxID=273540 RepID=A0A9Q0JT27_9MAGN|nr:hypothetical protein NE237_016321 [Protea cynaroides]